MTWLELAVGMAVIMVVGAYGSPRRKNGPAEQFHHFFQSHAGRRRTCLSAASSPCGVFGGQPLHFGG